MSTFVKICGLRDADDVAAAIGAGANAVGFVFAESVRQVTPQQANEATQDIQPGVRRVAVMRHPSNDECAEVLRVFAPDVIQTDVEDFSTLSIPDHVECWPVYREGSASADAVPSRVFLYEGPNSGSGQTVDWSTAARIARHGRMLLAGGLAEDNVGRAIREVSPWGVDVSSGVESLPGRKDHELIKRFVSAVRAAEKSL